MGLVSVVVTAVWVMLPAYIPNNVAVVAGGGRPIDGGRTWHGARLLGDGKTWRGTATGILAGLGLAVVLTAAASATGDAIGLPLPGFPPGAAVTLPAGAMLGDIAGSFIKRRTGRDRGTAFPLLDQLDFVAGALALTFLASPGWARATFTPAVLVAVVLLTPVLHLATNGIGYALGLKQEPW